MVRGHSLKIWCIVLICAQQSHLTSLLIPQFLKLLLHFPTSVLNLFKVTQSFNGSTIPLSTFLVGSTMRWFCLVSLVLPFIVYFLQPQEGFRDLNHSHRRVITVGRTGLNGVSESAGSAPPSVTSLLGVAPPPTHRDVTTSVIAVWLGFQFIIFIRTSQQIFHFAFFYRN